MSHMSIVTETQTARTLRRLAREATRRAFRKARRDRITAKSAFLAWA